MILNTKNYSTYKKTKEVYFSNEFSFLIIPVLIASAITYGLLSFFGSTIAILFNVFISFWPNLYFYSYGKSQTNLSFNFLISVLVTSCLLLFGDYGVYALVLYQKTGMFNKIYFLLWLIVLLGTPIVYYGFQYGHYYLAERAMALTYMRVSLDIHHDRELLTYIDGIQFVNASKHTMSDIKLKKPNCFYSETELKKMDSSNRNYYLEESVFSETIHLPFNADFLFMSWYSVIENKYYDIELPFPFDKLVIEQEKYPTNVSSILRGKKTDRLHLHIYANGGIKLFNSDTVLIDHPYSIPTSITDEIRNEKIKLHRSSHEYYNDSKAFSGLIEKIKASGGIEERFLIQSKLILWSMSISGLKGNNYFDVFDVAFKKYKSENNALEESLPRFLPNKIEIVYRGDYLYRWLILRINTQKLYQCIKKITDNKEEISVYFDVVIENSSKTDLRFTISTSEKTMLFTDWEIEIDADRKQSMEDHLLDIDEDNMKRNLLKESWELIENKQYDLAQEKYEAIIALDPRYGFAYFLQSRLVWYKEGFEACYAKRDYFIAKAKHEPSALAHIYNGYGCLLDQESRYEESITYFEKAIESYPKEGLYACNLAEMYCKIKQPEKALEFANKSKKSGYESATLNIILKSKGMNYELKTT